MKSSTGNIQINVLILTLLIAIIAPIFAFSEALQLEGETAETN